MWVSSELFLKSEPLSVRESNGRCRVSSSLLQVETMSPHLFTCETTVRHGFPFKPISVAFDPIQGQLQSDSCWRIPSYIFLLCVIIGTPSAC